MVQRTPNTRRGRGPDRPLIADELERLRKKPPRASKTEPLSQLDRLAILKGIRDGEAPARIATQWVDWMAANRHDLTDDLAQRAQTQLGTLGSGNHFLEVCLDEQDQVWVVVHSGSRVDVTGETARARWFISTRS